MAEYDYIDIDLADRLFIARSEIVRLTDEIERLRAENQRMRRVFEETIRILNSGGDDAR